MIEAKAITEISEKEHLGWAVIEKDYFLTLILEGLSLSKKYFIFKGGTAIRKAYVHNYRYSEDLDFTLTKFLTSDEIRATIESTLEYLKIEHNAEFRVNGFNSKPYFSDIKIQFVGLKGTKNTVTVDCSPNELIVDEPQERVLFNPYYAKRISMPTYTLDEILAEKLRSMIQRTRVRDFYDVWYLLTKKKNELDMKKIADIFHKKVKYKKIEFRGKEQLIDKERLEQAKAYYTMQLAHQIRGLLPFDKMSEELRKEINALEL